MRYGPVAIVVELVSDSIEERAGADGSVPCIAIHLELLEVDQIDYYCAIVTAET